MFTDTGNPSPSLNLSVPLQPQLPLPSFSPIPPGLLPPPALIVAITPIAPRLALGPLGPKSAHEWSQAEGLPTLMDWRLVGRRLLETPLRSSRGLQSH
ncbi:unnamed protein product [Merluccius merluccius]